MIQQINLYQPLFRKQEKVFSAKTLLQSAAIVLVGLVFLYGFGVVQTRSLQAQLVELEHQRGERQKRLEELARLYPGRQKSSELQQEIAGLRRQIEEKRQVVAQLSNRMVAGNRTGFADRFEGLARQRLGTLWLTRAAVLEGGEALELRGSTLEEPLVATFVQRLATEPSFAGLQFRQFEMSRPTEHPERIDFVLRTRVEEPKAEKRQ